MTAAVPPDAVQRWRKTLSRKGMDINQKLTDLLSRQNATLATIKLPNETEAHEPPERRLRRFLDQIIRAQRRLGTPDWGLCSTCRRPFERGALDDTPWIEECAACANPEVS
ncbi:MAG: hypothetical protein EXR79_05605 [Myxococcales bacterium]|nr:hypothetical protein [Myxococcales bacterium]